MLQVSKMITRLSQSSINNDINAETYGQNHSFGTLRVGYALGDWREQVKPKGCETYGQIPRSVRRPARACQTYSLGTLRVGCALRRPARTIIYFYMVPCWQATYSETSQNNRIKLYRQGACEDQHRCKPVAPPLDVLKKSMVISTYVLKRK